MEQIRIIHTNDLHSHFENWPKIRRFVQKKQQASENETVYTVDLGDFSDRWHPLTEATDGKANVTMMNSLHYDLVTIGNNEGVGNAKSVLNHLYDEATFEVILANLFDKQTLQLPKWAKASKVVTTGQGTKIGFIGLTAAFPLTYSPNGWDIRSWKEILPKLVQELKNKVDVIVLLSHLGIEEDQLIATELPTIDVIIGSHTHHLFVAGKKRNGVQLAAAGKFGNYVGEVLLEVDHHRIKNKQAQTFKVAQMSAHPEDSQEITDYMTLGHQLLQEKKVAWLPHDLTLDLQEGSLILETLEAVKKRGQTKVAILNTGLFLDNLPKGYVDQDELHHILPHPMHLIKVTLKGKDMRRLILEMEKNRLFLRGFPVVGMGFRGKIFGEIVYSGITYDKINHDVLWLGKSIDETKEYCFTTVDHLMFAPFFPTIEIAGTHEFLFPEFIRTVLGDHLSQKFPLSEFGSHY
ncbi:MAG TPA: bifunctional metallophosphatase/5'-nucleotidase [Candidatus Tetragenococcus pullicola]|nr:bifunctional metallophosphatase/5'-nucleotidase [Candidatus Tetragenococcus pullicola]